MNSFIYSTGFVTVGVIGAALGWFGTEVVMHTFKCLSFARRARATMKGAGHKPMSVLRLMACAWGGCTSVTVYAKSGDDRIEIEVFWDKSRPPIFSYPG